MFSILESHIYGCWKIYPKKEIGLRKKHDEQDGGGFFWEEQGWELERKEVSF